jgi:hypothetical protein
MRAHKLLDKIHHQNSNSDLALKLELAINGVLRTQTSQKPCKDDGEELSSG